jgi:phospholipid/cholesterol/gamma-HCH transport system substrate-binding protein
MKNTLETRLGIFVTLAVLAAVLILDVVGGTERFQRGYRLNALFSNIQDLKVGDRVKMAGVEIGRIEKISLDETNNKVKVAMKLKQGVAVRTDSTASIKFTGLMGQNYVAVEFGSSGAPVLLNDNYIPTTEAADFSAIMKKMDNVATGVENLTKTFSGDKIDNLLGPFTDFLKANRGPLTASIANLQAISSQIRAGEGTIGKLIYDQSLFNSAQAAVTNLDETAFQVKLAFEDARKIIGNINSGQGTVGRLVKDDSLYRETTASMTNLKEVLLKINKGDGTVGKLINDQEFYKNAKLSLQKLDQATEGLEDQGPLSVLGTAVTKLF